MTIVRTLLAAAALAFAATGPASAQDHWTGPYLGPTLGQGFGEAVWTFHTDGQYNSAAGQTFVQPLYGTPIGGVIGYNWQRGGMLYGVESFFYSHGISAVNSCLVAWENHPPGVCGSPNPYIADGDIDMKGHWFTGITGRIGFAEGGVMAYLQGGIAIGHLVQELTDYTTNLEYWAFGTAIGATVGAGFEVMIAPRWSIGLGYRAIILPALRSAGVSRDRDTEIPAGPGTATDHSLQYGVHEILGRLIFHPGRRGSIDVATRPAFDWPGFYMGWYAGALWQLGLQAGYDWSIGNRMIAGISVQGSFDFCCGPSWEADINGRLGIAFDQVMLYAEAGAGMQTGSFFGVVHSPFVTGSLGIEYAFNDRLTAFIEAKAVHGVVEGVTDGNFQAGLNFHFGHR